MFPFVAVFVDLCIGQLEECPLTVIYVLYTVPMLRDTHRVHRGKYVSSLGEDVQRFKPSFVELYGPNAGKVHSR